MKTLQSILASTALIVGLGLAPALLPAPAFAVDNMSSTDAPDLTSVRAKIKAQDYAAALTELRDLAEDVQQADVYNLPPTGLLPRLQCQQRPQSAIQPR